MKSFVDQQVSGRGYGTSSEHVREPIRKDQARQLLLEGAESTPTEPVHDAYFDTLRARAGSRIIR